jgi:hypothetical protein
MKFTLMNIGNFIHGVNHARRILDTILYEDENRDSLDNIALFCLQFYKQRQQQTISTDAIIHPYSNHRISLEPEYCKVKRGIFVVFYYQHRQADVSQN